MVSKLPASFMAVETCEISRSPSRVGSRFHQFRLGPICSQELSHAGASIAWPCWCPQTPLVEPDVGFSPVRLSDDFPNPAYPLHEILACESRYKSRRSKRSPASLRDPRLSSLNFRFRKIRNRSSTNRSRHRKIGSPLLRLK